MLPRHFPGDQQIVAALREIVHGLTNRIQAIETNPRSEFTGGVQAYTFAALMVPGQPGRLAFVSDGRKAGEGPGAGTGVLCYDDGTNWETCDTSTPVAV